MKNLKFKILILNSPDSERGNILVTSLMILLVMNLLGIGLANISTKEWVSATYKSVDDEVFHMTDSCSQDVVIWFGEKNSTPTSVEQQSGTPTNSSTKLSGYTYNCTTAFITSKEGTSSRTSGEEISNSGGSYSGSGTQVIKDYYQITSTGVGPKNASKVINTVISVEY